MPTRQTQTYLGDGLYATFNGFHIVLEANGIGREATDRVFLEPGVLANLKVWVDNGFPDYSTGAKYGDQTE